LLNKKSPESSLCGFNDVAFKLPPNARPSAIKATDQRERPFRNRHRNQMKSIFLGAQMSAPERIVVKVDDQSIDVDRDLLLPWASLPWAKYPEQLRHRNTYPQKTQPYASELGVLPR
jgi:hypothetical protein